MKFAIAALALVAGCASAPRPAAPVPPPKPVPHQETLKERRSRCADLYEHLVDVSMRGNVFVGEDKPTPEEYGSLRQAWMQRLEEGGVKDAFTYHCLAEMDEAEAECAAKAATVDGMKACAR